MSLSQGQGQLEGWRERARIATHGGDLVEICLALVLDVEDAAWKRRCVDKLVIVCTLTEDSEYLHISTACLHVLSVFTA